MNNNMVMVKSASDFTVVINIPELQLKRIWRKRGAEFPIDRQILFQAYYNPAVETLFKEGTLYTNDKEFLRDVGLIIEVEDEPIAPMTEQRLLRLIKNMPYAELPAELEKLSFGQIQELIDYAVKNYKILQMDRIDLFSKISGTNVMKAIEHYKIATEG